MRRWIAVFAVFALAAIIAAYMALFPLAPLGAAALQPALERLDETAAHTVALSSRAVAVAVPLAAGCALALLLMAAGRGGRREALAEAAEEDFTSDNAPPQPSAPVQDSFRQGRRRRLVHPDPELVWRPEPDPVEPDMDHVPGLMRSAERERAPIDSGADMGADAAIADGDTLTRAREVERSLHGSAIQPIVLRRRPRERDIDEQTWFDSASWFGGLPRLGDRPWPRDAGGPLPFAAQIDLAELAALCPGNPLPQSGSLAFFLGSGAVVEVPEGNYPFNEPPADLPAAFDEGGQPMPEHISRLSRLCFPFWPIAPAVIQEGDAPSWRAGPFAAQEPLRALWWYGPQYLADCLHVAMDDAARQVATERERCDHARNRLAELEADPNASRADLDEARAALKSCDGEGPALEAERTELEQMMAAMDGFVAGRDPWTPLTAEEMDVMDEVLRQVHRDCGRLVRFHAPQSLAELATISLRAMMTGEPAAFARIPENELTRINARHLAAVRHPHQLFGETGEQDAAHVPLLMLGCDDMMEWNWGEGGIVGFWISLQDLSAARWENVTLMFDPE